MLYRINAFRWRLAKWIAPSPIIAKPSTTGSAILVADSRYPNTYGWVVPKTLDITIKGESFVPALDQWALGTVLPSRSGTITGTV